MPKALVAYANGSEDLEVTAVASILSRGGVEVVRAAIIPEGKEIVLAHGQRTLCEVNIAQCQGETYDLIVIPGGLEGSKNCASCPVLTQLLKEQKAAGRYIAAICAAPGFVLEHHGLIGAAQATGYPGCSDNIKHYTGAGTTIDPEHKIVTGKGPALAIDFGLACLSVLVPEATLAQVKAGMLYQG